MVLAQSSILADPIATNILTLTDDNLQWLPVSESFWIDQALCPIKTLYTMSAPNTNAFTFFYDIPTGGIQSFIL